MSLTIIKRFEFEYAHFLPGYPGPCADLHGHRGELEVGITCQDNALNDMGMVADFGDLKKLVQTEVISILDHSCLNNIRDFGFPRANPTAEKVILWIKDRLKDKCSDSRIGAELTLLRLWETRTSYVEWRP